MSLILKLFKSIGQIIAIIIGIIFLIVGVTLGIIFFGYIILYVLAILFGLGILFGGIYLVSKLFE